MVHLDGGRGKERGKIWGFDTGESAVELSNIELMVLKYLDREDQHKNGKNWA